MTVQRVIGDKSGSPLLASSDDYLKLQGFKDGDVICQWFEDKKLESATFSQESLKKVK
jgi:uncharacterized protein YodC (DUF2158 family)